MRSRVLATKATELLSDHELGSLSLVLGKEEGRKGGGRERCGWLGGLLGG